MLRHILCLVVGLFIVLRADAQEVSGQVTIAESDHGEHDFVPLARQLATAAGLADLRTATLASDAIEVRMYSGFGISGTRLLRLSNAGGSWTAEEYDVSRLSQPTGPKDKTASEDWQASWRTALAAGLTELPPVPRRTQTRVIEDGFSIVFEIRIGATYKALGADNPDLYCSEDDRAFLAVAEALAGRQPRCPE